MTSPNATIDLKGFTLHGSNVAFHGIAGGVDNVTIRGGTITGFKFDGIHGTGDNWRIERMRVETNGRDGIVCGFLCLVKGAAVARNQIGILISTGIVLGSVIGNNASFGIQGSFTGVGNSMLLGNNGVDDEINPGVAASAPQRLRRLPLTHSEKPMSNRACTAALCAAFAASLATPAFATGEILLTHAKALAGNVTPGDTPGYPIHLTLPAVYQFAGNLQPTAGSIAIAVTSPNVTIDLNGFTLHGSGVAFHGIAGGVDNVTIRNGTIAGFKFDGIHGAGQENWTVEDMRVVDNGRIGVVCGDRCLVEGAIAARNQIGLSISNGIVLGSVIGDNRDFGISGFFVGVGNSMLLDNNGAGCEISPAASGPCTPISAAIAPCERQHGH